MRKQERKRERESERESEREREKERQTEKQRKRDREKGVRLLDTPRQHLRALVGEKTDEACNIY